MLWPIPSPASLQLSPTWLVMQWRHGKKINWMPLWEESIQVS
jgi:hypothetical protein